MPQSRAPRLLIFDSGLGGLTVLRALRQSVPEADVAYLADDARFPYSALADDALIARTCEVLAAPVAEFAPDAIVVACNTASTAVLPALRAAFRQPIVGTVPAVKPAALLSRSGLVSVLGTSATARRDYTRALIAEFGQGRTFTLAGSSKLAGLAETIMTGGEVEDAAILAEIAPCFIEADGARTDVVVLACTHYPLLLEQFERLAPWPVAWLDPAPAIARRTANVLADLGFAVGVGAARDPGRAIFTSGKPPTPELAALLKAYRLALANEGQTH
ncbi:MULTISPECIES: glutamate racemase [Rhodomicrobium]|uniref:glutamate racemase n=1 Tax=Rhodomicrobium TaxID=1068 RepID=UPI000B4BECAB|nr:MULTISPECIES: glutamate racemase [Rhodomicrobium]